MFKKECIGKDFKVFYKKIFNQSYDNFYIHHKYNSSLIVFNRYVLVYMCCHIS